MEVWNNPQQKTENLNKLKNFIINIDPNGLIICQSIIKFFKNQNEESSVCNILENLKLEEPEIHHILNELFPAALDTSMSQYINLFKNLEQNFKKQPESFQKSNFMQKLQIGRASGSIIEILDLQTLKNLTFIMYQDFRLEIYKNNLSQKIYSNFLPQFDLEWTACLKNRSYRLIPITKDMIILSINGKIFLKYQLNNKKPFFIGVFNSEFNGNDLESSPKLLRGQGYLALLSGFREISFLNLSSMTLDQSYDIPYFDEFCTISGFDLIFDSKSILCYGSDQRMVLHSPKTTKTLFEKIEGKKIFLIKKR